MDGWGRWEILAIEIIRSYRALARTVTPPRGTARGNRDAPHPSPEHPGLPKAQHGAGKSTFYRVSPIRPGFLDSRAKVTGFYDIIPPLWGR